MSEDLSKTALVLADALNTVTHEGMVATEDWAPDVLANLAERGYVLSLTVTEWRDHIPSGYEDQSGYGQVSCSCGWDSGGKLDWEAHIDAAERVGRA